MSIEQRRITSRDEWLRWRADDVTASDVGALAGVDEYKTPLRVYAEKTGQALGPQENEAMRRGRWLEPAVLMAVHDTYPDWEVKPAKVYLRDPSLRLGATPDSFAVRAGISGVGNLQLKVVARPTFERDWSDGRVPMRYVLQTLTEAMLAECEWAAVAALVIDTFGAELVVREVPRHPAAEQRIREMAVTFWSAVQRGLPPPANYTLDLELIKAMHAQGGGEPVDFSGDDRMAALCEQKLEWAKRRHNAEAALDTIDAEIMDRLGAAEVGQHPDFNITWKPQTRREAIIPAATFRVLRVTRRGKKAEEADHAKAA